MAALTPAERDAMWAVFARYYEGVTRAVFERDLAGKDHVVLLSDVAEGRILGFSTLARYRRRVDGRRVVVVFSGDTIVDEGHWGGTALQHAFGRYITRTRLRHPFTPAYWFLVSKGYKTYLLLTRNFPSHWPRHDRPTPSRQRELIHALARDRFGDAWRPESGIVRSGPGQPRLRAGVAPVDAEAARRDEVRFFLQANPGHADGDELACLGRITVRIWIAYAWRKARRRWTRRTRGSGTWARS